jgi:hypothetical protein
VGLAAGAIVGGLAGKAIAERVNPTVEDTYWREHYRDEPYYEDQYPYEEYQGAYRTGYEGYGQWGASGKRYEDVEPELRKNYESNYGKSRMSWEKARLAARAAWDRVGGPDEAHRHEDAGEGRTSRDACGAERPSTVDEMRERGEVPRSRRRHE